MLHFNILPSNDGKNRIHIFYDRGGRLFNVETQFLCFDGTPNYLLWFFRSIRNRRANVISINVGLSTLSYKDFVCEFGENRFFETPDALVVLNFDSNGN